MPSLHTPTLEIEYEEHGDPQGPPVLLLHGFPDSLHTWRSVIAELTQSPGPTPRLLTPHHRGFGRTRLLHPSEDHAHTGQFAALAQDALDFLDALNIPRATLVGHDWGTRSAYGAAVLDPSRVAAIVTLASEYIPHQPPTYPQLQAYWYQWLFQTKQGEQALSTDPAAFGAYLWQAWSPHWHFDHADLAEAQATWTNPDFVPIVLSYYRHRHGNAPGSPRYAAQQAILDKKPPIQVPTIFATGLADACNLSASSLGQEQWFTASYERIELPGIGHFLPREAPHAVATLIRRALSLTA